jgi:uncharacterized protein (TIGR00251 family)
MSDLPPYLRADGGDVIVDAWVQPRAAKNALVGFHGRALKVKVTAPPVDGKANDAICRLIARWVGVPPSRVEVVAGHSSRSKRIRLFGVAPQAVTAAFALVLSSRAHDGGQEAIHAEDSVPKERRQEAAGEEDGREERGIQAGREEDGL